MDGVRFISLTHFNRKCDASCIAYLHRIYLVLQQDFKDRVEELRKAVQAAEKNRQAAMRALAEERQRSLELQVKISRQVLFVRRRVMRPRMCILGY